MSPPMRLRCPMLRWPALLAESRLGDLPFDVVEFVSEVDQIGIAGRRRTEKNVGNRLWGRLAPLRDRRNDRRRLGVMTETDAGHHALQCRRSQRIRRTVACAPRTVQASTALDGLGSPDHDR